MLNWLKSKVQTLLPSSDSDEVRVNTGIKRKRHFEESPDSDEDVQGISLKKPRLEKQASQSLYRRFIDSDLVQTMSDWVQNKPKINLWQSAPSNTKDTHRVFKGNGLDQQRRSDLPNRLDSNGGSHHRFQKVDMSVAYTKGNWPVVIRKHVSEPLSRRPLRMETKSTPVQTDIISDGQSDNSKKGFKNRIQRLFKTRNSQKFTAGESIRLGDKVRYQQLIQQCTTVPLETPEASLSNINQQSVVIPQLPRSYCKYNDSILRSRLTPMQKHPTEPPDRPKIKVQPSLSSTQRPIVNGSGKDDSVMHITDISAIPHVKENKKSSHYTSQNVIDLTADDEVQSISEGSPSSRERSQSRSSRLSQVKSPVVMDYMQSKYMSENWIKDLNDTYAAKARERQRFIAENELRAKVIEETRQREIDLEKRIRQQMKISRKEPPVIEIESSSEEEEEEEEEEVEESLPELTNEMENQVNNCLRGGSPGQVLVDKFKLQITRGDIATLSGLNWLNDEIINFYMNLLMERGEKDSMPKVHAFNTFFYPKVMSGGQSAVKRWTRRVDVLAVDYILVPVHLGMHWCLAVINFKKKDIQYYDSMGGCNTECLNALKKYLCDESMEKKNKEFDLNGWTSTVVKDIPQQMNGSDCGMFACKFADYITRERPISFTQEHMPYFRRRMVYEIVNGKLLE